MSRKAEEGSETTAALRAEVAKGEAELAVREERVGLTEQELEELQKVHQDLEGDIASVAARQAAELTPQIEALEAAVDEARAELAKSKASLAKVQRDRNEVRWQARDAHCLLRALPIQRVYLLLGRSLQSTLLPYRCRVDTTSFGRRGRT